MPGVSVEVIPAWLYFAGPMVTALISALSATVVMHYRAVQKGKLVPASTVHEMREQYEKQLKAMVEVSNGQLVHYQAVLNSKDNDIDRWRGAFQIVDEANRQEQAGQTEELIAFSRVARRFLGEFQRVTGVPELPAERGPHE